MKKILAIIGNVIIGLLLLLGIIIAFSLLPIKNNIQFYTVRSGSMKPTIPIGSVIAVRGQSDYQVGDIITFLSQSAKNKNESTTHRIISKEGTSGNYTLTTKGDANDSADGEKTPQYRIIGRTLFHIPMLGYLLGYIKTLPGLLIIIIIPASIIVYEEVKKIHKESRIILEKRRANKLKNSDGGGKNGTKVKKNN